MAAIGLAMPRPGDVGRGAVDRLVQAAVAVVPVARFAERGAGHQAHRASQHGGLVGEQVAEQVVGDHHVELGWPIQQVHGQRVGQDRQELDVREVL